MRCLVHLDMDCFYAQVEAVRLGIDCRTTPYALVQWGNLIAVNYPARDLGVKRFQDTPKEAQERHPELRLSHIATYEAGSRVAGYPEEAGDDLKHEVEGETKRTKKCEATNSTGAAGRVPRIATHKVALEPYREASRRIFSILRSAEGVSVGKAGIDEAYLDVTEAARRELAELTSRNASGAPLDAFKDVMEPTTRLIEERTEELEAFCTSHGTSLEAVYDGPMRALKREGGARAGEGSVAYCVRQGSSAAELEELAANTLLLCAATRVVKRLRDRIYEQLHYDCSAGIAHNRLLAKAISATHKPNQQTLLLPDRVASALFPVKLSQLRGFGGKFGDAVTAACGGAEWCREAWLVPLAILQSRLSEDGATSRLAAALSHEDDEGGEDLGRVGEEEGDGGMSGGSGFGSVATASANSKDSGTYVYLRSRGYGPDSVSDPAPARSLMANKVFHPFCASRATLLSWLTTLTAELHERYCKYHGDGSYSTRGRTLVLRLAPSGGGGAARLIKRQVALSDVSPLPSEEVIKQLAVQATLRALEETKGAIVGQCDPPSTDAIIVPLSYVSLTVHGMTPVMKREKGQLSLMASMQAGAAAAVRERGTKLEKWCSSAGSLEAMARDDGAQYGTETLAETKSMSSACGTKRQREVSVSSSPATTLTDGCSPMSARWRWASQADKTQEEREETQRVGRVSCDLTRFFLLAQERQAAKMQSSSRTVIELSSDEDSVEGEGTDGATIETDEKDCVVIDDDGSD